jgi:hypothetical protein
VANEEIKQAKSLVTAKPVITSTEPHVHFANLTIMLNSSSSDNSSKKASGNQTGEDDQTIEAVTEINTACLYGQIYQIYFILAMLIFAYRLL